jgi:acyl carrier protein
VEALARRDAGGSPASEEALLASVRGALSALGLGPERVTPAARLVDDLELDSLDWVDLALLLEDELAVEIRDERLASLATVADLVALLRRQLHRRAAGAR